MWTGIVRISGEDDLSEEIHVRRSGCTDPDAEFIVSTEVDGPFAEWGCPVNAIDFGMGPEDEENARTFGNPVIVRAT